MAFHPCHLSAIVIDEESEQQTVLVSELGGGRRFPIVIGQLEALAIDRAVKGQVFPRPLTHDLLLVLVDALRAERAGRAEEALRQYRAWPGPWPYGTDPVLLRFVRWRIALLSDGK